jgi:tetratricopeptide (TPR) repeat protein
VRIAPALAALSLVAFAAPRAAADRATAEFYAQRGEASAKAKEWAAAQGHYKKALEEDPTFLPARAGLAEAFLGSGERQAAVDELRLFATEADALSSVPAAWTALVLRTRKRLAEMDPAGAALEQIAEKYVADLVVVGERWTTKDPDVAATAWREVVRLRPKHPKAQQALEKIVAADLATRTALFSGKDKKGWTFTDTQRWTVEDGLLVCNAPGVAGAIVSEAKFRGDFDVRMEARVLGSQGPKWMFALFGAVKGLYRHSTFGVIEGLVLWIEERDEKDQDTVLEYSMTSLPPTYDPKEWHWYEMRFRGDQAHMVLDGRVIGTTPRGKDRDEGSVGVRVQDARVAIRRVDVRAR